MSYIQTKWIRYLIRAILVVCIIYTRLPVKAENQGRSTDSMPDIYAETFVFESDQSGKGRVDMFIQIPYSEINFTKENEQYSGRFEISAVMLTQEKQQVWQKSQLVELRLKEFSKTVSKRFSDLKQFSTDLPPGKYELVLQITDKESDRTTTIRKALDVRDLRKDSLALSDLMIVNKVTGEGTRKNIVPNLTGTIEKGLGGFYLFFEIYNHLQLDSVQLSCKFINSKQEVIASRTKNEVLDSNRTQVIWQIDTPALTPDKYLILIETTGYQKVNLTQPPRATVSCACLVRMKNLPLSIDDIDKATEQLLYIAKENEIDYIREAATPEEKLKRFLEFWAKHNPSPKSSNNDLMEEYYARVIYANKNFSGFREGWRTDRGMVLIQFGQPQNVDRHPFNAENKPYEIWYYYDQNRQFIFIDNSGFGDYLLQYPTTDLWGRIR